MSILDDLFGLDHWANYQSQASDLQTQISAAHQNAMNAFYNQHAVGYFQMNWLAMNAYAQKITDCERTSRADKPWMDLA